MKPLTYIMPALIFLMASCHTERQRVFVPARPDYADAVLWFTVDTDTTGTGADIFYLVSTWETDWLQGDSLCHWADVYNPAHREHMAREMAGVAAYMAPGNRFFSPYYRHTTIEGWMTRNEDTIYARTRPSMDDVCRAFDYFAAHRDPSRPLILAGFSQGGMAVVELLKHMSDEDYAHLAAAYVMGYKLTATDTLHPHIRPAQSETDTRVTVCYNTVKDTCYIIPIIAATVAGINPVNWRTDATPALLSDSITVTLDTTTHVLVVSGYSGSEYHPYKGFINVGDLHGAEPWLYRDCIRRNMNRRVNQLMQHE